MTVSGDFIPEEDIQADGAEYPTAFGIQFTPPILGALIGLVGVGLAIFAFIRLVQPALVVKSELEASIADKRAKLANSEEAQAQIAEVEVQLQEAMNERRQVYDLFASPEELSTLMLDINQQILPTNVGIDDLRSQFIAAGLDPQLVGARLVAVTPDYENSGVIQPPDARGRQEVASAYPPELAGVLERRFIEVGFQGDFGQTLSIIRNVERLEPLIILRDFNIEISDINEEFSDFVGTKVLDTTFRLEALVPVNDPEELPEPPPPVAPAEGEAGAEAAPAPAQ